MNPNDYDMPMSPRPETTLVGHDPVQGGTWNQRAAPVTMRWHPRPASGRGCGGHQRRSRFCSFCSAAAPLLRQPSAVPR